MVLQDYTPQHMLATLRTRLLVMYAQVDIALEEAARSYEKGEAVRAIAVCDGDTAIDALENEIDELCLRLMARIKPVAGDLRFVVAALRMVVDLERIGDEAVTVAEQTVLMEDVPGRRILADEVCGMMQRAREAFMRAMDCFREGNGQEALALRNCEDEALQNEMRIVQRLLELLRQASFDPSVLAIKINIYRVAKDSRIIDAMIHAAHNGKKVTVVVELQARFDEEANIHWAKRLT